VTTRFTVKTRIGFDTPAVFDDLLPILARHGLDLVTVHGRTVAEMYRSAVHYDAIAAAVAALPCPVLANGNVYSAEKGERVLAATGARGLMIGRGAIRNPWIFEQFRQRRRGEPVRWPTGREVLGYVRELYEAVRRPDFTERSHVTRMKKFVNYLAIGVEPTGEFLERIRRAETEADFFAICAAHLDHEHPLPLEPYPLKLGARDVMGGEQG
jgi:tRNA-dihydrouridine synthase